jgi:hypothetical protein
MCENTKKTRHEIMREISDGVNLAVGVALLTYFVVSIYKVLKPVEAE